MKKILTVLLLIIAIFVGVVMTRPNTVHVERSTSIAAAPEAVYANVVDFHRWPAWSPWEKLDPNMKKDYEGAGSGVGAAYHWAGNDKVGEGRMTIAEADPARKVGIQLDFIKPFAATNTATFAFTPSPAGTDVVWAMDGQHNFISKAMCLFVSMDQMVGKDFETGLAQLKTVVEAEAAAAPADTTAADTTATP